MTQEDKELLLKDLCTRLPYGVKVMKQYKSQIRTLLSIDVVNFCVYFVENDVSSPFGFNIEDPLHFYQQIKPYLRPMSSMTAEEMEELKTLCSIYIPTNSPTIGFEDYGLLVFTHHLTNNSYSFKLNLNVIDWLLAHHFDYRGLIPKGLAIEVTKENNPYE